MEPKIVNNIQVFLGFAIFYYWFIKGFNKIVALFISMLRTIKIKPTSTKVTSSKALETNSKVGGRSIRIGEVEVKNLKNLAKSKQLAKAKKSKVTKAKISEFVKTIFNKNLAKSKMPDIVKVNSFRMDFFFPNGKLAFIKLR